MRRLLLWPLARTHDYGRALGSWWIWGEDDQGWRLTPLGIVNTLRWRLMGRRWAVRVPPPKSWRT